MKQNLCLYGLAEDFVKNSAKHLADDLGMYFADVGALIEFDLQDVERAELLCGKDYIKKIENKVVKSVSTFDNTLFVCDFSLLNDDENLEKIRKTSYLIYLKMSNAKLKKRLEDRGLRHSDVTLKMDMAVPRDKLCKKFADIVVSCNSDDEKKIVKNIKTKLLEYMKNGN